MMSAANLRPCVIAARKTLADGREKIRLRHAAGAPGIQVCEALCELVDGVVLDVFDAAWRDIDPRDADELRANVALVAHSGYGRRDMAPHSDVDVMVLHAPEVHGRIVPLVERFTRDLFDTGLVIGHSVRTPKLACQLARRDMTICTALIESRFLAGGVNLFTRFTHAFQRMCARYRGWLLTAIDKERTEERIKFGATNFLLEPNLKRSRGGLRDVQLLRWTGFVRFGVADPETLRLKGELPPRDHHDIREAWEFLLRLRNELHFRASKANDVLDRHEQPALAERFGYEAEEGLLPVEMFMRDYFRHTSDVARISARFLADAQDRYRWTRRFEPVVMFLCGVRREDVYRVSPWSVWVDRRGRRRLARDMSEVLRLIELANLENKPLAHAARAALVAAAPSLPDEISGESARRFLALLAHPARLGEMLRELYDVGLLEKLIPAFRHARGLLQYNEYHRFTVDEHSLQAVERATEFQHHPGVLGQVYREIKNKSLLHLALLIHDLGKGFEEEHCEVGLRIARDVAARLRLSAHDAQTLEFLVHQHLRMSHVAMRLDISDPQLLLRFALEVGSPEVLRMLYVLTAADFAAVGPGRWDAWKEELLTTLYFGSLRYLTGDSTALDSEEWLRRRRRDVVAALGAKDDLEWYDRQLALLPSAYLHAASTERIIGDLRDLRRLTNDGVHTAGRFLSDNQTVEYTVGTFDGVTPGVFHKLTGALSGQGLQILSAEISTLADGLVFDRFVVHDPDFAGEPPPTRIDAVRQALINTLRTEGEFRPTFRSIWTAGRAATPAVPPPATIVKVDNSTSERATIVEVFAADRLGLLFIMTRAMFRLGLSVTQAKISTFGAQVVDTFYVTDQHGEKLIDPTVLDEIPLRLTREIDDYAARGL